MRVRVLLTVIIPNFEFFSQSSFFLQSMSNHFYFFRNGTNQAQTHEVCFYINIFFNH